MTAVLANSKKKRYKKSLEMNDGARLHPEWGQDGRLRSCFGQAQAVAANDSSTATGTSTGSVRTPRNSSVSPSRSRSKP